MKPADEERIAARLAKLMAMIRHLQFRALS